MLASFYLLVCQFVLLSSSLFVHQLSSSCHHHHHHHYILFTFIIIIISFVHPFFVSPLPLLLLLCRSSRKFTFSSSPFSLLFLFVHILRGSTSFAFSSSASPVLVVVMVVAAVIPLIADSFIFQKRRIFLSHSVWSSIMKASFVYIFVSHTYKYILT